MNKTIKTTIAIVVGIIIAILLFLAFTSVKNEEAAKTNLNINNEEDLTTLVDKIYAGVSIEMPNLMTQTIDKTDADAVKTFTGLDSSDNLEYIVASEPMMSSQAYSLVLVKAKEGTDVDTIAKTMNENINERKWICVSAEKIYTTTSGNIICLVMTNEETAKSVFESFKTLAGTTGKVYERAEETLEMPEDMLFEDNSETPNTSSDEANFME